MVTVNGQVDNDFEINSHYQITTIITMAKRHRVPYGIEFTRYDGNALNYPNQ